MSERVYPTKLYQFKGLRRTNRGSIALLNNGLGQYKHEEGVAPTSALLSTLRRETLPEPKPVKRTDGTEFLYGFSEGLQLNQIQCSRRDQVVPPTDSPPRRSD